jgi:hypothetical protein
MDKPEKPLKDRLSTDPNSLDHDTVEYRLHLFHERWVWIRKAIIGIFASSFIFNLIIIMFLLHLMNKHVFD